MTAKVLKGIKFDPLLGTPPSVEFVAISELMVDEAYQRSIESTASRSLIVDIARHWDWRLCMPLVVSRRETGKFVIDGQHRLAAARMRPDIPYLPCCIASYAGSADEARMFIAANRTRRPINNWTTSSQRSPPPIRRRCSSVSWSRTPDCR